jgi:AcrR family transcriptional regulator
MHGSASGDGSASMGNEVRTRIVDLSKDLFFTRGFTRVTMDDLASACGISKKTLYVNFPSKDALIHQIICQTQEDLIDQVSRILNDSNIPVVKRLKDVINAVSLHSLQFAPLFLEDVKRFQPKGWKDLQDYKRTSIADAIHLVIRDGQEQGYIRKPLPEDFIVYVCFTLIDNVLTPATMFELSMSFHDTFENVMSLLFEGFLTDAGRKAIYAIE